MNPDDKDIIHVYHTDKRLWGAVSKKTMSLIRQKSICILWIPMCPAVMPLTRPHQAEIHLNLLPFSAFSFAVCQDSLLIYLRKKQPAYFH